MGNFGARKSPVIEEKKNPSENTVGRRFRPEYEIRDFVVIFTWVILYTL